MKITLKEGHIFHYDGDSIKVYGSNLVHFVLDDDVVVALDNKGRVHEYRNGIKIKSYGNDLVNIRLKNGVVIANDRNNYCYEFVDGLKHRSYMLK
jgi:hypothetical protein